MPKLSIKVVIALCFIVIAVLGRTVFHYYPNVELVTAVTLLSAVFLGGRYIFFVPLITMFISDTIIGNTAIYVFTWSAYLMIGLIGLLLRRFKKNGILMILSASGISIATSTWFFLWTNFGVWLISGLYPQTLDGLVRCYVMAIPFFKYNLIGNLVIVPVFFCSFLAIKHSIESIYFLKTARG